MILFQGFNYIPFLYPAESIPVACARVDALRSHGHRLAAVRLAAAVARTMRHYQRAAAHWWRRARGRAVDRLSESAICRQWRLSDCNKVKITFKSINNYNILGSGDSVIVIR